MAKRTVYCEEALTWLSRQNGLDDASVITSLPDVSETMLSLSNWKVWFSETVALLIQKCPEEAAVIFYQTDIKRDGEWIDKSYLCHQGASSAGGRLLWHKIACRRPAGSVTFGRPGYAHLVCYSRGLKADLSKSTADVLPNTGQMTWSRATGVEACRVACKFVLSSTSTRTIVDPFCGHGTILAVANAMNLDAIGVDHSRRRCARARTLNLDISILSNHH